MKLVIEFDLDGDLDNLANFHSMAFEFFSALETVIPNNPIGSFSAFTRLRGTGEHGEVTLLEVKVPETEGENVVARAMILDAPMIKTGLSRPENTSIEERSVDVVHVG